MKKDLAGALEALKEKAVPTAAAVEAEAKKEVITAEEVEAYKRYFGAKWDRYARRGNPYGEKKGIGVEAGDYRRATLVMYAKQYKALQTFAAEEGLTLKDAVEITLEVGLRALGAKGSEDITLTPEDVAPKFTRKK